MVPLATGEGMTVVGRGVVEGHLPAEERDLIVSGNATRVFGL